MSIITEPTEQPSPAKSIVDSIRDRNTAGIEAVVATFRENFARTWHHAQCSPQQIFDEFGTSARDLFSAAQKTIEYISALAAINGLQLSDYLQPVDYTPPLPYVINEDGTVTVGA